MGEALLGGLLNAGWSDLGVVEKIGDRRDELSARFPTVDVRADITTTDAYRKELESLPPLPSEQAAE